ncbi:hypothetical protein [Brevundimonas aveniformis]|uniref:hypothetical protein n=1 Tax=Brevundimonas aveniformis TaxID=370977 RepID=UPI00048EA2C7|nr:hypothetical protein [Brevundimonas aveniformis]
MTPRLVRLTALSALMVGALGLQGCLAGAVVGTAGAVVGAAAGAAGAVVGAGVDAVTTSDAEEYRQMRRECERRVRRGANEDCSAYRPQ